MDRLPLPLPLPLRSRLYRRQNHNRKNLWRPRKKQEPTTVMPVRLLHRPPPDHLEPLQTKMTTPMQMRYNHCRRIAKIHADHSNL